MSSDRADNPFSAPTPPSAAEADDSPLTEYQLLQLASVRAQRRADISFHFTDGFAIAYRASFVLAPIAAALWAAWQIPESVRGAFVGFAGGVVMTGLFLGWREIRAQRMSWPLFRRFLDWDKIDATLRRADADKTERSDAAKRENGRGQDEDAGIG